MTPEEIAHKVVMAYLHSLSDPSGIEPLPVQWLERAIAAAVRDERETPCSWCMNGEKP